MRIHFTKLLKDGQVVFQGTGSVDLTIGCFRNFCTDQVQEELREWLESSSLSKTFEFDDCIVKLKKVREKKKFTTTQAIYLFVQGERVSRLFLNGRPANYQPTLVCGNGTRVRFRSKAPIKVEVVPFEEEE